MRALARARCAAGWIEQGVHVRPCGHEAHRECVERSSSALRPDGRPARGGGALPSLPPDRQRRRADAPRAARAAAGAAAAAATTMGGRRGGDRHGDRREAAASDSTGLDAGGGL